MLHSWRILRFYSATQLIRKQWQLNLHTNRFASHFKRPNVNVLRRDHLDTLKVGIFQNRTELKDAEWQEVRQQLMDNYKHVTANNIDAVILGVCNESHHLPLAKNYIENLRKHGKQPNLASVGRLLRVYNAAYHARGTLDETEQNEILEIYAGLRKTYDVLDATTCENLIYGLVATAKWTDGKELLEMNKLSCVPSLSAYSELTRKAFAMHEMTMGWQLLEEMVEQQKEPKCEIFIAYLNEIAKSAKDFVEEFEKLLYFLQQHEIVITEKVIQQMQNISKNMSIEIKSTNLSRLGKCKNCSNFLENISITDAEYKRLNESFLTKVLIRSDVFQKSTPEEVQRFKRFVEQTAPYDCVIDGLNVAYSMGNKKSPQFMAKLLADVVKFFHNKNKHVLVLGRKHMNNWPTDMMRFVRSNASIFLTNNLTHDDPFLLYATIKSGQMTDFFSRDLMRTHAYLLGPELKIIFRRWQQEHQYSLVTQTESGKVIIKEPVRHLICAHKVQDIWHIPYKTEYCAKPAETFDVPKHWACINIKK